MARVQLQQVTKSFGDTEVIPPLDLDIEDGAFVVLVGPSGCGKTTSLRMIAGLETATSGAIHIGPREVTGLRPGLRNCAMVFQNYALYPHMTVAQNITYGMRVRGEKSEQIESRLKEAARILGLEPYLERRPKHLSGGQQQRVAIGRAIVRNPDVFLFDEPLSNLDAKLRVEMRTEIKQLHRRLGNTVVYVTHDQVEAMTLADRVVVMNQGKIAQAAPPIELYEKPANTFVAGFIGAPAMNFLSVELVEGGGTIRLGDGTELPLPPERRPQRHSSKVTLGMRPEHSDTDNAAGAAAIMIPREIEPLGPHMLLIGELANQRFVAQVDAHHPARLDEPTTIHLDTSKVHLFDPETGDTLLHGL